jgi:hypothetical protein
MLARDGNKPSDQRCGRRMMMMMMMIMIMIEMYEYLKFTGLV